MVPPEKEDLPVPFYPTLTARRSRGGKPLTLKLEVKGVKLYRR